MEVEDECVAVPLLSQTQCESVTSADSSTSVASSTEATIASTEEAASTDLKPDTCQTDLDTHDPNMSCWTSKTKGTRDSLNSSIEDVNAADAKAPKTEGSHKHPEVIIHSTDDTMSVISSIPGDMCRICHCYSADSESMISPCGCDGSMKYVHQVCLQKWVKARDTKKCELCGIAYNMTSSVKPFRQWNKLDMSSVERRKVLCSVTFHVVAITCVIWSLYVLIDKTAEEINDGRLNWPFWTKLVVVAIGFTGGLVFMYVQCKMYVQLFRKWKQFNRVIYINDIQVEDLEATAKSSQSDSNANASSDDIVVIHMPNNTSNSADNSMTTTTSTTVTVVSLT